MFNLYGDPLNNGVFWTGLYALIAIVVAGLGVAGLAQQRRDIGS